MTNYENIINLPLNFNANNHASNNENNAKIGEQLLNKMSQRDFSEVSRKAKGNRIIVQLLFCKSNHLPSHFPFPTTQRKKHVCRPCISSLQLQTPWQLFMAFKYIKL